jgi:SAM-dependent methyltransferase
VARLTVPAETSTFARRKLLGILSGSWLAQACYAAAKLGLPDAMAAGPRPVAELAVECGADPRALDRLLRAMVSAGVFCQTAPRTYALTSVSELLRSDAPGSLRQMAVLDGEEVYRSFADIVHTVRTGTPAFESIYGEPFYAYLAGQPRLAATFVEAMSGAQVAAALALCDLTGTELLVDVGGGDGSLLAEALTRHPALRGVLLELPEAVRRAKTTVTDAGVADRAELVEGDFFAAVPASGDAYVLARVLHNWTDERAEQILRRIREAMRPDGRLLVVEQLLPDADTEPGPGKGMVDLLMLVLLEGHDRTQADYVRLLERAGFALRTVRHGSGPNADSMLEAVPV